MEFVASYARRNMEKIYMILGKREKPAENSGKYNVFLIFDTFWQNERKIVKTRNSFSFPGRLIQSQFGVFFSVLHGQFLSTI